jgi:hypothetical protein
MTAAPEITAPALPAAQRFPLYVGGGAQDTEFLPDTRQFIATVQTRRATLSPIWCIILSYIAIGGYMTWV